MVIAVDFDGTIVSHKFPEIGNDIGAIPVLKNLVKNGHKLILNTMRSNLTYEGRNLLKEATDWLTEQGVEFWGINSNPEQKSWTNSNKVYANLYIDDSALGCPKRLDREGNVVVDWEVIDNWFKEVGIINTIID